MENENSQLQNLMNYTIFHIGLYITLLGIIIGVPALSNDIHFIKIPFICFLIAGACGGVIASNIPEHKNFSSFSQERIGVLGLKIFKYKTWAALEHLSFWIATLWIAIQFVIKN